MNDNIDQARPKRILLSGVFGPYGVDDDYGRAENVMELFHNQVTRGQGLASFRFMHRSFGLYFIAANVDADVTVLDFPSQRRFVRELEQGYDIVGISFITPNFTKAKEMARLTRSHAPGATIVLGGHGAAIEGVEDLIECDHVVRGEGIRWLRGFLGQDPDAPIVHPALPSTDRQSIFGVPVPGPTANLLVTGVGCVNGCSFCCTSHFFGRRYTPFIGSGRELFETARQIADIRGTDTFFIMDENFLKDRERALDLIGQMERHERFFSFHIFSSAEAITAFGVDNLVRLGAQFVWIGFESHNQDKAFAKNQGIDPAQLVKSLRDRGISVLASGILCMEHHTPDNMQDDVDFLVGLEPDMLQFMLLTGLPVTALYRDHQARGILRDDVAFEDSHGQKLLNYHHPAFADDEPARWLNAAFRQDYVHSGSSMYRVLETALRGYQALAALPERDACLEARLEQLAERVREYAVMLPVIDRFAVNDAERERARALGRRVVDSFGPTTLADKLRRFVAVALAIRWKLRLELRGDTIQPRTLTTRFTRSNREAGAGLIPIVDLEPIVKQLEVPPAAAAAIAVGRDT